MFNNCEDVKNVYFKNGYSATIDSEPIGDFNSDVTVLISIYKAGVKITEYCCRKYNANKEIWPSNIEIGPVVEHLQLLIEPDHKLQNHARRIHNLELESYKNNYKQIQLTAVDEGAFVWPYLGFKFKNNADKAQIRDLFLGYLYDIVLAGDTDKVIDTFKKCDTFTKMKPYCVMDGIESFTEYIKRNNSLVRYFLYKDIGGI